MLLSAFYPPFVYLIWGWWRIIIPFLAFYPLEITSRDQVGRINLEVRGSYPSGGGWRAAGRRINEMILGIYPPRSPKMDEIRRIKGAERDFYPLLKLLKVKAVPPLIPC